MRLGIDFGTSNSAAAIVHEGTLLPIRFGDAEQFRTSVYFPGVVPDPDDFQLDDGQEHQLQQMIDSAARAALSIICCSWCSWPSSSWKSSGSGTTPGKYTLVRNCSASPKRIGSSVPSCTMAAAELLVPKSMPRRMGSSGGDQGPRTLLQFAADCKFLRPPIPYREAGSGQAGSRAPPGKGQASRAVTMAAVDSL